MELEKLREYQKVAHRTAIYPRRKDPSVMEDTGGVIYTVLGLCGECGEYHAEFSEYHRTESNSKVKIIKEAGDVCWYLVEFMAELDIPVDALINSEAVEKLRPKKSPLYYASVCAELIKKAIRDQGRINAETLTRLIANLQCVFAALCFDMETMGIDIETVLEENNRKLLSRLERGKLNGSGGSR
jgi:NTP pyrophosphatase (non-canonical NTP hydrolase)